MKLWRALSNCCPCDDFTNVGLCSILKVGPGDLALIYFLFCFPLFSDALLYRRPAKNVGLWSHKFVGPCWTQQSELSWNLALCGPKAVFVWLGCTSFQTNHLSLLKQAASLMERNNRLAYYITYQDPILGCFGAWSYFLGIWLLLVQNLSHILAQRCRFPVKVTKFRAKLV